MSVKSTRTDEKLTLELDNGDYREFDNAIKRWNFKDEESLIRFAISILVLNENTFFRIKVDDITRDIIPGSHLLK